MFHCIYFSNVYEKVQFKKQSMQIPMKDFWFMNFFLVSSCIKWSNWDRFVKKLLNELTMKRSTDALEVWNFSPCWGRIVEWMSEKDLSTSSSTRESPLLIAETSCSAEWRWSYTRCLFMIKCADGFSLSERLECSCSCEAVRDKRRVKGGKNAQA